MILADSGYFIALASAKDQHFHRAIAWMRSIGSERLLVTEYVLLETVNALSKSDLRQRAADIADAVQNGGQFEFLGANLELLSTGLELYRARPDKDWSLTDCISFSVMKRWNITRALSNDHHFEQAGFEALLRRDP